MNTEQQTNERLIIGLKTQVKCEVGLKKWEQSDKERIIKHLIKSWLKLADCLAMADIAEDMVWDYAENTYLSKQIQSKEIGVFTYIDDYTKKNGEVIKAHYSVNGNYIGTAKKLGNEPVSYLGWFKITRKNFKINFFQNELHNDCADVSVLFVPKK